MSQSQKRTGARDISELKARLGLNKKSPSGARGGAVPPPGAQRSIPAPPGAQPPQPDPSSDPFGAMNAAAASRAQQQPASPEFVIVNDGQPVESVETSKRMLQIGKIAGIALVPLVFGVVVGQISSSAKSYNHTIDDALRVRDDVRVVGRGLVDVQTALFVGKERGPGGNAYLPHDEDLVNELDQLEVVEPNPEVAYRSYLYELEPQLVSQVFSFYTDTQKLYEDLSDHVRQSRNDARLLQHAEDELSELTQFSYGAYVQLPEDDAAGPEALPRIEVVEIGQPVCEDGRPRPACPGAPRGFQYRPDPSGPWGQMELAGPGGIEDRNLMLLRENPMLRSFVAGPEESLASHAYLQRLADLEERIEDLIERRGIIEDRLTAWGNQSKRFTFFL